MCLKINCLSFKAHYNFCSVLRMKVFSLLIISPNYSLLTLIFKLNFKLKLFLEKSAQDDELSGLTVQVSELEMSLEELSAAKSLLETQLSEIEVDRDRVKEKLEEVETSAKKLGSELEVSITAPDYL